MEANRFRPERWVTPMADINGAGIVSVQVGAGGEVWVNVDGACRFRAKESREVLVADDRFVDFLDVAAERFAQALKDEIGPHEFAEMLDRNGVEENPNICHSHDFTDANVVMSDVLEGMGIVMFPDDEGTMPDRVANTFNEVWTRAELGRRR
jgi:hypothetical protein